MRVLICYDGSEDAKAAVERAGQLMRGSDATVLVIWETLLETLARSGSFGMGFGMILPDGGENGTDAALEKDARETADEGVALAKAAGLVATPAIAARHDEMAAEIIFAADALNADVIVLGTRGRSGAKSLLMGSVSTAVLHHADRAVLIIPSPALAQERHGWADHARSTAGVV
jgi:nucleotide-binding universal stress UspA family protein